MLPVWGHTQPMAAYELKNVEITLPDGNPAKQREHAIEQATKEGFVQLLQNLTPPMVWHKHAQILQDVAAESYLESVNIVKEVNDHGYQAVLDITFRRDAMKALLAEYNLPYSEVAPLHVLLFPVLDFGTRQLLWEEHNPWRTALEPMMLGQNLVKLTLPAGELHEIQLLSTELARLGASDVLQQLTASYGADYAVVAEAKLQSTGFEESLLVEARWFGDPFVEPVRLTFPISAEQDFEEVLTLAAKELHKSLTNRWRDVGLVRTDLPGRLFVRFAAESAPALERLRTVLGKLSMVEKIETKLISLQESVFQVDYFGNEQDFITQLRQMGLAVAQRGALWQVQFTQAAPAQ